MANKIDSLPLNYFTNEPLGNQSEVYRSYKSKVKSDLVKMISRLVPNNRALLTSANSLDISLKWNPVIFFLREKLLNGIKENNENTIHDTLFKLSTLNEDDIYSNEIKMGSILEEDWDSYFVEKLRNDKYNKLLPLFFFEKSSLKNKIYDALEKIKEVEPEIYKEFYSYVTNLKFFNGSYIVGATSPEVFGSIFLSTPKKNEDHLTYYIDHLVHETSHLHLHQLMGEDRMVLNPPNEKYPAPIREDLRPMYGVFHATYVLSRIVRVFSKLIRKYPENNFFGKAYEEYRIKLKKGLQVVTEHGNLTPSGTLILKAITKSSEKY